MKMELRDFEVEYRDGTIIRFDGKTPGYIDYLRKMPDVMKVWRFGPFDRVDYWYRREDGAMVQGLAR